MDIHFSVNKSICKFVKSWLKEIISKIEIMHDEMSEYNILKTKESLEKIFQVIFDTEFEF